MGVRLQRMLAHFLADNDREAVLGDLLETRESGTGAVVAVLGLVARRQAEFWLNWQPWLTLAGFVIPTALALHLIAVWDTGLIAVEDFRRDLPSFLRWMALAFGTLACWSFLLGGVLRTLAPATLVTQLPALLGVMSVGQLGAMMSYVRPAHPGAGLESAHDALAAWVVQIFFVAIPLFCGALQRVPRLIIFGVVFTIGEFIAQLTLNHPFPLFVAGLAVYWPFAFVAARIGKHGLLLWRRAS